VCWQFEVDPRRTSSSLDGDSSEERTFGGKTSIGDQVSKQSKSGIKKTQNCRRTAMSRSLSIQGQDLVAESTNLG
jgi:hypothetical protein